MLNTTRTIAVYGRRIATKQIWHTTCVCYVGVPLGQCQVCPKCDRSISAPCVCLRVCVSMRYCTDMCKCGGGGMLPRPFKAGSEYDATQCNVGLSTLRLNGGVEPLILC